MSERLLLNANSAMFQLLYHDENYLHSRIWCWWWCSLCNSPRANMLLEPDTLTWFLANQSVICMLSGKARNTNLIVFGLTKPGLEPTFYHSWGEHAISPPIRLGPFVILTMLSQYVWKIYINEHPEPSIPHPHTEYICKRPKKYESRYMFFYTCFFLISENNSNC